MNTMQLFQEEYTATDYAGTKTLLPVQNIKLNIYRYNYLWKKKA